MTDTEILDWLEAELKRGKTATFDMIHNPNVDSADYGFTGEFFFFTVHSQHLKATSLREAREQQQ